VLESLGSAELSSKVDGTVRATDLNPRILDLMDNHGLPKIDIGGETARNDININSNISFLVFSVSTA